LAPSSIGGHGVRSRGKLTKRRRHEYHVIIVVELFVATHQLTLGNIGVKIGTRPEEDDERS
jgi:hypothetical protein